MTKKNPKYVAVNDSTDIPSFTSDEEEAQFWADHELGDALLNRMDRPPEGLLPPARSRAKPISLRIDPAVLIVVKSLAQQRGMGYQTLMKQFLLERLAIEEPSLVAETVVSRSFNHETSMHPPEDESVTAAAGPASRASDAAVATFPRVAENQSVCRRATAVRRRGHVLAFAP
jgi:predicted DNA binding CopG/RHH family protein